MAKLVHVEWKLKPRKPTQTVFPQTNSHIWARFKTNLESKAALLCRVMLTPHPHQSSVRGCKHQGGDPPVRIACTLHPSRRFLTVVLYNQKDGKEKAAH